MPDDPIQLRLLNDYLYCPRRCALHQLEGLWHDNAYTVSGTLAHEIADDPGYRQTAEGARLERALPLFSDKLGLVGKADIVEFWPQPSGPAIPLPVDYKLGPRRKWDNDDVQLCAQALCLEEMLHVPVPRGAVYHVKTRRRRTVEFNASLRTLTRETIECVRALLAEDHGPRGGAATRERRLPPAVLQPQCDGCSLHGVCLPELTAAADSLDRAYGELFATGSIGDSRI
jgi:CRISPR-associated exonuclease Cas4